MRFPHSRRRKKWNIRLTPLIIPVLIISVGIFLVFVNTRLNPIFLDYAKVQTNKIASLVISRATNSRVTNVMDVNDIIEEVPSESSNMVTTRFNTEIINRVRADTTTLVQSHLEQAEQGNLELLPETEYDFDHDAMQEKGGIVFYVPLGQAANIPLIGNLGPKIPIRFHLIGNVESNIGTDIREFGINNAYVEVYIHMKVNVQIIIPMATTSSVVEQRIPVAIGLVKGPVPHIYTSGESSAAPSVEVPLPLPDDKPPE